MRLLHVLPLVVLLAGCGVYRDPVGDAGPRPRAGLDGSLFTSDTAVLGNDAVGRILDGAIEHKPGGRLAVLPIGHWNSYSAGSSEAYIATVRERLGGNTLVGEVVQIPRILLPDRLSVPVIREVAARLQCESVLIYNVTSALVYDHRLFAKDQTRSRMSIDAVLLHVRTGVLPIAVVRDQAVISTQQKGEDAYDHARRAEREATLACLDTVAREVGARLK